MEVRRLGESKVKVSAVTFGAWAIGGFMWGGNDEKDSIAAIRAALDHGIDTIDTAPVYGMGASETIVGKAIEGRRDDVRILTKFGLSWDTGSRTQFFETVDPEGTPHKIYRDASPQRIREECDASLRRLRTDYIDLYQIHWADPDTPIEATFEVVARMIEQGKILAAGVCNYTPEQIEAARKVVPLASCQPPYSMINRGIESDVLPYCRERGIGVVAYSPMQRGLLTGKIDENKEFPASDTRAIDKFFSRENRRRVREGLLDRLRPIADAKGCTLAQLVIAWTIAQPGITAALVGARNARQAEENAGAANVKLSAEELAEIRRLAEAVQIER